MSHKSLRTRIIEKRRLGFKKHTKEVVNFTDATVSYDKTTLMKLTEIKVGLPLHKFIFKDTIYKCGTKLGIHPSTVSKWRKYITEAVTVRSAG